MADAITRIAAGESSEEVSRRFVRRSARDRPDPAVLKRQGEIALLAFRTFSDRDAARLFLNEYNDTLEGRPIDIAGENDAGYARIAAALADHS